MSEDQPILSPCIGVCSLDEEQSFCVGCGRTPEQIARWSLMDDEERQRIMSELDEQTLDA